MGKVSINFIAPNKGYGFHLTPTIYCWTSDFTCVELRDVMGFKSYGICLKIFKWQMGLCINIKPKTYNDNNKCSSSQ
jgi:hypothetical protein